MDNVLTKRLLRGGWVCIVLIALAGAFYWLLPLVYPFLIAWLISFALNPLVQWLQSKVKLPRWLAVTAALILFVGGAGIVLSAAVTRLVKELIGLAESLDFHIEEWRNWFVEWSQSEGIQNIINEINRFIANNPGYENTINQNIDNTTSTISSALSRLLSSFLSGIVNLLTSLPNFGVILIVILLSVFFISKNWERNMRFLAGLMPSPFRKTGIEVWKDLQKALFGYLRAQFIMISITAVIVLIGLLILRVDSAFTYAILIGFVDLLPYLGVGTVMVPWLLYTYMSGDTGLGIGLSILYGVILVARQLIEPKVLASSVGLDPLPTLISMFVGLKLFGVFGLIIGPVSFVVFGAIARAGVLRDLRNYILNGRLR
ncbi:sporulation integral membrane protein YtvI [Fontibacillus phaseoli]|uniref:Sporulation integral membrane protein YtvI n=1 Tax=Fontibacillus phaseoli TaxID=1416533 RepID=A0A369B7J6_9BACL|nr:sporulation integral membrane protein YtvI [Fontibacillus phaseoli]RCX17285.1 sporulation integral membrane protein YtvI [Fontibacillus phaseoli]